MNVKAVFAVTVLLWCSSIVRGQGVNASLSGSVSDPEGNGLAGVTVTALNVDKNAEKVVVSEGREGRFRLMGLAPGAYQVSFELAGYYTYVASGIRLSGEQSLNLHIKLRRSGESEVARPAVAAEVSPGLRKPVLETQKRKFSVAFNAGLNYLAVGDTNKYLRSIYEGNPQYFAMNGMKCLHSGVDLNMELSYQVSSRLDAVVAIGLIQDQMPNNNLELGIRQMSVAVFRASGGMKAFPLQLTCRYWLNTGGRFFYSVYGSMLFTIASWRMQTEYYSLPYPRPTAQYFHITDSEIAHAQGLGLAAGLHGGWSLNKTLDFTIDLAGRYAPMRNFSGQREWNAPPPFSAPTSTSGNIWFYEYFDSASGQWLTDLSIGGRPAGPGTRNVARANVDFSGLALRFGLRVHL
jgi:hypothetical protein